ncbi:serine dehydratase subunit alpha family protein [Celerinatantimonas sp. YJH-8]|uniref:L-cysteine desulfidase family protein n=1 Tax=Celerinatantimonas sp. YJH-8 TaxID=3228714 RepID=UPI0038BEB5B2
MDDPIVNNAEIQAIYLAALQTSLRPALGCTEPLTVALASAHARCWGERLALGAMQRLDVMVSANLFKNAAGVFVPGTGMTGLPIAAAMGWYAGRAEAGLEVLADSSPEALIQAKNLLKAQRVRIDYQEHADVFYTHLTAVFDKGCCEVFMGHHHDELLAVDCNQQRVFQGSTQETTAEPLLESCWSIEAIVEFCQHCALEPFAFVMDSATLNSALSQQGLTQTYGLAIGAQLRQQQQKGWLSDDLASKAMIMSASASDARMAGAPLAAMSNSGSGNQGIAATMPVVAVAESLQCESSQLLRALLMSHLIAIYIKRLQSPLSALCAATTAAMGSAAAINWLLGGDVRQVQETIRYMIGDISGIYCDGAKPGCALKVSTAAAGAVKAALLGLSGQAPRNDGVLENSVDASLAHLGQLTHQTLQATDQQIVRWIAARAQF